MKDSNYNILRCYAGYNMADFGLDFPDVAIASETIESQLLHEIYKLDEDGMMQGDLVMFLNDKVRPEIKEFIRQNLFITQNAVHSVVPSDGLSEDEQVALSPSPFDSYDSYVERVRGYLDRMKDENIKDD